MQRKIKSDAKKYREERRKEYKERGDVVDDYFEELYEMSKAIMKVGVPMGQGLLIETPFGNWAFSPKEYPHITSFGYSYKRKKIKP